MRNIVKEVIDFVEKGRVGAALRGMHTKFGKIELRLFCINLASWWARSTLMQSHHPYLPLHPTSPGYVPFCEFVMDVAELNDLVVVNGDRCEFRDSVSREEWNSINEYARLNYKPRLIRKSHGAL